MLSSPMLLSFSTVFALIGLALVLIAGVTDNWSEYSLSRSDIYNAVNHNQQLSAQIREAIIRDPIYYSRTYGLMHICFPDEVPQDIGSSPKFGSSCIFNNDYFPANTDRFNSLQKQRLWMMRGNVVAYAVGVAMVIVCLLIGIVGCYQRSARITRITAYLLMFASLLLAVSIALWHAVYYEERRLLQIHPFYLSWEPFLKKATTITIGRSYIVAWIGLACCFIAAIFLLFSGRAIQYEENCIYESKHAAYYQQYYDKSLVPVSYGGAGALTPTGYGMYPPLQAAAYYGHPAYSSNYYGYLPYGA